MFFNTKITKYTKNLCDQLTDFRQCEASAEPSAAVKRMISQSGTSEHCERWLRRFAALMVVCLRFAGANLQKIRAFLGWSS
jgi:hypothetical protein